MPIPYLTIFHCVARETIALSDHLYLLSSTPNFSWDLEEQWGDYAKSHH